MLKTLPADARGWSPSATPTSLRRGFVGGRKKATRVADALLDTCPARLSQPSAPHAQPEHRRKLALVTGGTSDGIGRQLLLSLLERGWHVISIARPRRAAEHARHFASQPVDVHACDCADMGAVRRLAEGLRVDSRYAHLSLVVHSLGVIHATRQQTPAGLEENLAVNALAPWLLTRELMPMLAASGHGRVVQVSSSGLKRAKLSSTDLFGEQMKYQDFARYFVSKRINLHLMQGLQAQANSAGLPVAIYAAHPGLVRTELGRHLGEEGGLVGLMKKVVGKAIHHRLAISPPQAAAPLLSLAIDEGYAHLKGAYLHQPSMLKRLGGMLQGRAIDPWIASRVDLDAGTTAQLLDRCTRLVGLDDSGRAVA